MNSECMSVAPVNLFSPRWPNSDNVKYSQVIDVEGSTLEFVLTDGRGDWDW